MILTTRYEGSDKEEEHKIVSIDNNNNGLHVVSDSNSDSSDDDFKTNKKNLFAKVVDDKVIASPKTSINIKVIPAMKKLQALYNNDANKIIEDATHVKTSKNLNFLIDLAMITIKFAPVPEEPASFNKA